MLPLLFPRCFHRIKNDADAPLMAEDSFTSKKSSPFYTSSHMGASTKVSLVC